MLLFELIIILTHLHGLPDASAQRNRDDSANTKHDSLKSDARHSSNRLHGVWLQR